MVAGRLLVLLALLVAPLAAEGQQAGKVYRVGVLLFGGDPRAHSASLPTLITPSRQSLWERGWVEGRNVTIEARNAMGNLERRNAMAAELMRLNAHVIVTLNTGDALAAQKATKTIPIVTVFGTDAVGSGLAMSLARPGGNVTGLSAQHEDVMPKMLDLLKITVPTLSRVAVLSVPGYHNRFRRDMQAVAPVVGVTLLPVEARAADQLESAFNAMRRELLGVSGTRVVQTRTTAAPVVPTVDARQALEALRARALRSITKAGTTYQTYSAKVGETKIAVDPYPTATASPQREAIDLACVTTSPRRLRGPRRIGA